MATNRDAIFELVVLKKEAESQAECATTTTTEGDPPSDHHFMIAREERITAGSEEGRSHYYRDPYSKEEYEESNGASFDNATYETSTDACRDGPKQSIDLTSDVHRRNPHVLGRSCCHIAVVLVVVVAASTTLGVMAGLSLASLNYIHLGDLEGVAVSEATHLETARHFQAKLDEMAAMLSTQRDTVATLGQRLEQVSLDLSTTAAELREAVLGNQGSVVSQGILLADLSAELRNGLTNSTLRLADLEGQTDLRVADLRNTTEGLESRISTVQGVITSDSVDVFGGCTVSSTPPSSFSLDNYTVVTEPVVFNHTVSIMRYK